MDRTSSYYRQVQLLVLLLPLIAEEKCFALRGGTAINLFVRELPRLSVDIDLVYLLQDDRQVALNNIAKALTLITQRISDVFPDLSVISA
ncbi:MAG: nucleotidyl transferase AbiEii/AbiGii toxin family protein [Thiotrichaceae bacterium]|nr:nucleotidyl transferase AbiEii/AbiGii toxin family protein [Thiotrichaceae bacterium]